MSDQAERRAATIEYKRRGIVPKSGVRAKPHEMPGQMSLPGIGNQDPRTRDVLNFDNMRAYAHDRARAAYQRDLGQEDRSFEHPDAAGPGGQVMRSQPSKWLKRAAFQPSPALTTPREDYGHVKGQMVMGTHDLAENNPSGNWPHELDHHGNVLDHRVFNQGWFSKHSPQFSETNTRLWEKFGELHELSTQRTLHTGQPARDVWDPDAHEIASGTNDHRYVQGPMDRSKPVDIMIQHGIPFIADGHHRLAEYRGRGEATFPARVFNHDQFHASLPTVDRPAADDHAALHDHFLSHHGIAASDLAGFADRARFQQIHDAMHRNDMWEHKHA